MCALSLLYSTTGNSSATRGVEKLNNRTQFVEKVNVQGDAGTNTKLYINQKTSILDLSLAYGWKIIMSPTEGKGTNVGC